MYKFLLIAPLAALCFAAGAAEAQSAEYGYQREECPFDAPPDALVVCGGVTVPENRQNETGKIYLPVVRIIGTKNRAETPAVILGGGGPGGPLYLHEETVIANWNEFRKNLLGEGGELILLDPRGSGEASPSLTCPDTADFYSGALHIPLTVEEEYDIWEDITLDCLRQWNRRVNLASYTTDATVDDMEAIRRALKIRQWDIIGLSHGTRLALELIRRHPDGVRAAILDSAVPADDETLQPRKPVESVLNRINESCARDEKCERYGDLRENLDAATKRIADKTPSVTVDYFGNPLTVALTPSRLYDMVLIAMYGAETSRQLPRLAMELAKGEWKSPRVTTYVKNALFQLWLDREMAWTLLDVVNCGERLFVDSGESDGHIFPGAFFSYAEERAQQYCRRVTDIVGENWFFVRPPVVIDKPMIIVSGLYDVATPPEHAQVLANRLPNAKLLTLPMAHTPLQNSPCATEITRRFLESPNAPLSDHCQPKQLAFE